ncbi:MAG TPA: M48 family metalloprotease [Vicinamibacterales bacterium]|nr:M48 family metalloprotease [Vicinamibacterales bacterium]
MNEDKAVRYNRLKRRAAAASLVASAVLLVGLAASGAAAALAGAVRALVAAAGVPPALAPAAVVAGFVVALAALEEIVTLPIAWHRGFVLERRYGLSRETPAGWLRDHARAWLLGTALGVILAEAVYAAIHLWPSYWWVAAAGAALAGSALLTHLLPVAILPLFYPVRRLERPELAARLLALARAAGIEAVGVYEWGLGGKTRRANAALVGLGRTRRILLSDTLLAEYPEDEIEVVFAHELGHHVRGDIRGALAFEGVALLAAAFAADLALRWLGPRAGVQHAGDVAGLPLLLLGAGAASILLVPMANALSRRNERGADRYALELTGRPAAFASAIRRLADQNLADPRPSRLVELFFHTHPPLEERLQVAAAWPAAAR